MPIEVRWVFFMLGVAVLIGSIVRLVSQRQNSPRRRYEDPADNSGYADSE